MLFLALKALISGVLVAAAGEIAKRYPGVGGLIASLPFVAMLAMIWLWRDTRDADRIAELSTGTFWYVLPSLPMFLLIPAMLKRGIGFWSALGAGCAVTFALYAAMMLIAPRLGLRL